MVVTIITKLIAIYLSGVYWEIGGSGRKWVRRLGCPTLIQLCQQIGYCDWRLLPGWLIQFGVCTIGYGGDDNDEKPSRIYRFWRLMLQETEAMQATRITCAFLYALSGAYYAWVKGHVWQYAVVFVIVFGGVSYFTTCVRPFFEKVPEERLVGSVFGAEGFI